ncbi:hypothetical protein ACIBCS_27965 [Streptomyces phaeochromogenes]|uniref:hypothetical protein n=1 Tax=Streptomyces phaeochromogenes TaxID=1923 RepID=UPI0033CC136F
MSPKQSMTATAPSTLPERSITASLTAEIMHDLDDGRPTLVASTQGNQGDLQEVTPSQLLAKVTEVRARLDQIEDLARQYAAGHVIPAFIEHYNITVIEADMAALAEHDAKLAEGLIGYAALHKEGHFTFFAPDGQDPIERLGAMRKLILNLQEQGAQA